MAVNYNILAEVVDITVDTPKPEDVFLGESNEMALFFLQRFDPCLGHLSQNESVCQGV